MLAVARTFALLGVEAVAVDAEVDIHRGLPAFSVVGLPDAAVRESRERVRAAIVNAGFEFPLKRVTVSLAPSDLRKAGPGYDLAIAAAVLVASEQLPARLLADWCLAGELALDGGLRPVPGALAMAEACRERGPGRLALPATSAAEAALVDGLAVAPLASIAELAALATDGVVENPPPPPRAESAPLPDLADLRGQPGLRRALEVAAAGAHGLLVVGPPGAGKSLAARRLPSLLPPLTREEEIEVRRIAGVAGTGVSSRPFRAPHHTISAAGLVGGGSPPRPGEITLAHRGVLFLDEIGEFARSSLEALRQPLEAGEITIVRARGAVRFPAAFQLVAAANPCPCGRGENSPECSCTPERARSYRARLSGALADRIDLRIAVGQPDPAALAGDSPERSQAVRERVVEARARQSERLSPGCTNARIGDAELRELAAPDAEARAALERGQRRLGLSGRGWARALRVARTCADLDGCERIGEAHVNEALSLRRRAGSV